MEPARDDDGSAAKYWIQDKFREPKSLIVAWEDIQQEYLQLWQELEPLVPDPEYTAGPRRPRKFDKKTTLEAILKVLWTESSIRGRLGDKYPTGTPLHRDLKLWALSGALEKMLLEYFALIQENHLRAWTPRLALTMTREREHPWVSGIIRHVYWRTIARRAAETAAGQRGLLAGSMGGE